MKNGTIFLFREFAWKFRALILIKGIKSSPRRIPGRAVAGILAGMGPEAGAKFVEMFVRCCTAELDSQGTYICDQAYPEHWVAQIPFSDRSVALTSSDRGVDKLLSEFTEVTARFVKLGVTHIAIPCNTAHAWHEKLEVLFPSIEFLHIGREVAQFLTEQKITRTVLLATQGTYRSGIYQQTLALHGIVCYVPSNDAQMLLMKGIYEGVKAGDIGFAQKCFSQVAADLSEEYDCNSFILGCTEIPLAFVAPSDECVAIDAGLVLARALARHCVKHGSNEEPDQ